MTRKTRGGSDGSLPDEPEERATLFRQRGEAWGGEFWQSNFAREWIARGYTASTRLENVRSSLRKWCDPSDNHRPPDDAFALLAELTASSDRWVLGFGVSGSRYLLHRLRPRFYVTLDRRAVAQEVVWIDQRPERDREAAILAEARERAAEAKSYRLVKSSK